MNAARRRVGRLATVLALVLVGAGEAQDRPTEPQAAAEAGARVARAGRVDRAPRMDGTVLDPIWEQASPITDFRQREPYEGQPATEPTEVRVLYTRNEVYFGIVCHDSSPHGVAATQLRRDVSQEFDDYFEIVIDSRRDRRNA